MELNDSINNISFQKKRIAICYFGLTRSIKYVYQNHYDNLFNVIKDNGSDYDVYIHTWKIDKDEIYYSDKPIYIEPDYDEHKYLNPIAYQIDNEEDFLKTINFGDYYYENEKEIEWDKRLLQNFVCSIESKKRCFQLCLNSNIKYDYVIFIRPDLVFNIKLPYEEIFINNKFNSDTIIALENEPYEGYADVIIIISFSNAHFYSNQINEIKEFRKYNGRIVSEKYNKHIMQKYYNIRTINLPFNIKRPV